jgi:hypothetical protein
MANWGTRAYTFRDLQIVCISVLYKTLDTFIAEAPRHDQH